jgi:hypothetical protein
MGARLLVAFVSLHVVYGWTHTSQIAALTASWMASLIAVRPSLVGHSSLL